MPGRLFRIRSRLGSNQFEPWPARPDVLDVSLSSAGIIGPPPSRDPSSPPRFRQSGLGIASVVIAAISIVGTALLFVTALAVARSAPVSAGEEGTPLSYLLGTWIFALGVLSLIGIVFGVGGLRQRDRRTTLATLGLVANILIPITLMAIMFADVSAVAQQRAKRWSAAATSAVSQRISQQPARTEPLLLLCCAAGSVGLGAIWLRRRAGNFNPPIATPVAGDVKFGRTCNRCSRVMPVASRFCRRCGAALT